MIVLNWIVKDKLMIALSPIITHPVVFVDHECLYYTERFEPRCNCQSSLAGT